MSRSSERKGDRRGRESEKKEGEEKIMDTGSGRHGQSPDVRRATSQAKRFKSKGSSSRTSTVDSNRYGGVKVRVTLTVLVRILTYLLIYLLN